jgi:tetratricopeptide (TPR) repeat protein
MVIDSAWSPALEQLASARPKQVVSVHPNLDMAAAYADLVRGIPGSGPGFLFRRFFVALSNAAATGNIATASQAAKRALAITGEQGWPQLATAVHMSLGAAYFTKGDLAKALACYREANQAIVGSNDPVTSKLNIQTRLAEAAALIADGKHHQAADVYEATAALAAKHEESLAAMESCRMASWCREVIGDDQSAWAWAEKAVEAGESLDNTTRAASTLSYVGQSFLRLADRGVNTDRKDQMVQRMVQLLGPDWQAATSQGAITS